MLKTLKKELSTKGRITKEEKRRLKYLRDEDPRRRGDRLMAE
jgi:hypothetical protein